MTYGEAYVRANTLLHEGKNVFVVVSRIDGFYIATCKEEIGNGEVIQFVAPGPWQAFDLSLCFCAGQA